MLGQVLRAGANTSMLLFSVGLMLVLWHGPRNHGRLGGYGLTPGAIVQQLGHSTGIVVLGLGLSVLIATQVLREVTAMVLFLRHGERHIALLAGVVLLFVALSLVVGGR